MCCKVVIPSESCRDEPRDLASNPLPFAVLSGLRAPLSGFFVLHSAFYFLRCFLPFRAIMTRASTVKDILDEEIAKKLA